MFCVYKTNTFKVKSECFSNLFRELNKLETNPRIDNFLLLHFYKNIKEIQSDHLLLFDMYYIKQMSYLNIFYSL